MSNGLQIKTGDTLLVSSDTWLAEKIQDFEGCKWNHGGFIIVEDDTAWVFEALKHGPAFTLFDEYIKDKSKDLLLLIPKFDIDEKLVNDICFPQTKKPYDKASLLVHQAVRYIYKKGIKKLKKIGLFKKAKDEIWIGKKGLKAAKKFTCGELVAYIYHQLTGHFPDWHMASPADLFESNLFDHEIIRENSI